MVRANVGVIFLYIGNSQRFWYTLQSQYDWLTLTRSKVLSEVDWYQKLIRILCCWSACQLSASTAKKTQTRGNNSHGQSSWHNFTYQTNAVFIIIDQTSFTSRHYTTLFQAAVSCRSVAYWPTLSIAIVDKSHLITNTLYMFIILIAEGIQLSIQDTCQLPEWFHRLCKLPVMYLLSVKLQRFVSCRNSLNEQYFSFSFYNQSSFDDFKTIIFTAEILFN